MMIGWLFLLASTAYAQNISLPNADILSQCQCLVNPSGNGCLQYDARYQAATIEEAMASFPDLTLNDNNNLSDNKTLAETASCSTPECSKCHEELQQKLKSIGLLPTTITDVLTSQTDLNTFCDKYRFSRKDHGTYSKVQEKKDDSDSSEEDESKEKKEKKREEKKRKNNEERHERNARRYRRKAEAVPEAAATDPALIGERFTISCSAKGVTTDATGLISLCSSCWVWRKLPNNYTPQFINELVCDNSDNACLSGYASCGVGHRSLEVIRDDNGVKTTVVMSAGSYCECKVAPGSVLQSLVNGTGLPSPLPASSGTGI